MTDKVLIVEDVASLRHLYATMATRMGLAVIQVGNASEALAAYRREQPALVLLDVGLPDGSGFDVARAIRAQESDGQWTPIIFLTSLDSDKALVEGIAAGGDDYLIKPVSRTRLSAKVDAMRRISSMRQLLVATQRELRAKNALLHAQATVDVLTGLANRRRFDEHLAHEWRRSSRTGGVISLLLLDIDRFKQFNDTYGHQAGDECLRQVAAILAGETRRPGDLAARYGGEEFALLLPDADSAGAQEVARRLGGELLRSAFPHVGSDIAPVVTASIGVATREPAIQRDTMATLISDADRALYRAKAEGRNRYCLPGALQATPLARPPSSILSETTP